MCSAIFCSFFHFCFFMREKTQSSVLHILVEDWKLRKTWLKLNLHKEKCRRNFMLTMSCSFCCMLKAYIRSNVWSIFDKTWQNRRKKEIKKKSILSPTPYTTWFNNTTLHRTHTQYKTILIFIHSGSTEPLPPFPHIVPFCIWFQASKTSGYQKVAPTDGPPNFIPKTFKLLALHEEMG